MKGCISHAPDLNGRTDARQDELVKPVPQTEVQPPPSYADASLSLARP